eukprot:PhM_4_TR15889/c6_g1_i1/m.16901
MITIDTVCSVPHTGPAEAAMKLHFAHIKDLRKKILKGNNEAATTPPLLVPRPVGALPHGSSADSLVNLALVELPATRQIITSASQLLLQPKSSATAPPLRMAVSPSGMYLALMHGVSSITSPGVRVEVMCRRRGNQVVLSHMIPVSDIAQATPTPAETADAVRNGRVSERVDARLPIMHITDGGFLLVAVLGSARALHVFDVANDDDVGENERNMSSISLAMELPADAFVSSSSDASLTPARQPQIVSCQGQGSTAVITFISPSLGCGTTTSVMLDLRHAKDNAAQRDPSNIIVSKRRTFSSPELLTSSSSSMIIEALWDPTMTICAELLTNSSVRFVSMPSYAQTSQPPLVHTSALPFQDIETAVWTCDGHFLLVFEGRGAGRVCAVHRCGGVVAAVRLSEGAKSVTSEYAAPNAAPTLFKAEALFYDHKKKPISRVPIGMNVGDRLIRVASNGPNGTMIVSTATRLILLRVIIPAQAFAAVQYPAAAANASFFSTNAHHLRHVASHPVWLSSCRKRSLSDVVGLLSMVRSMQLASFESDYISPLVWGLRCSDTTSSVLSRGHIRSFLEAAVIVCVAYVKLVATSCVAPNKPDWTNVAQTISRVEDRLETELIAMFLGQPRKGCLTLGAVWYEINKLCSKTTPGLVFKPRAVEAYGRAKEVSEVHQQAPVSSPRKRVRVFSTVRTIADMVKLIETMYIKPKHVWDSTVVSGKLEFRLKQQPETSQHRDVLMNVIAFGLMLVGHFESATNLYILSRYSSSSSSLPSMLWVSTPSPHHRLFPTRVRLLRDLKGLSSFDLRELLMRISDIATVLAFHAEAAVLRTHALHRPPPPPTSLNDDDRSRGVILQTTVFATLRLVDTVRCLGLPLPSDVIISASTGDISAPTLVPTLCSTLTYDNLQDALNILLPGLTTSGSLALYSREASKLLLQLSPSSYTRSTMSFVRITQCLRETHKICSAQIDMVLRLLALTSSSSSSILFTYLQTYKADPTYAFRCDPMLLLFVIVCNMMWREHCLAEIIAALPTACATTSDISNEMIVAADIVVTRCIDVLSYGADAFVPDDLTYEFVLRCFALLPPTEKVIETFRSRLSGEPSAQVTSSNLDGGVVRLHAKCKERLMVGTPAAPSPREHYTVMLEDAAFVEIAARGSKKAAKALFGMLSSWEPSPLSSAEYWAFLEGVIGKMATTTTIVPAATTTTTTPVVVSSEFASLVVSDDSALQRQDGRFVDLVIAAVENKNGGEKTETSDKVEDKNICDDSTKATPPAPEAAGAVVAPAPATHATEGTQSTDMEKKELSVAAAPPGEEPKQNKTNDDQAPPESSQQQQQQQ